MHPAVKRSLRDHQLQFPMHTDAAERPRRRRTCFEQICFSADVVSPEPNQCFPADFDVSLEGVLKPKTRMSLWVRVPRRPVGSRKDFREREHPYVVLSRGQQDRSLGKRL